ncbi:hypothetical protein [Motilibacter aurantiacus]|uniref:hypothetical protein n=1 Tax=Motilibacter aurantiacus TaxID=2714955 RepID=UPI00140DD9E5|nr:hypothetical protein [Motilibacter aurantiacus]NHC46288.1 hypothetical protein [Motilibacter aurantiacus]
MYSLVSAPVLGFDLIRRAGGAEAADVLVTALALGAEHLPALAAAARPEQDRAEAWAELARATKDDATVRAVAAGLGPATGSSGAGTAGDAPATLAALRRLEVSGIGGLEDLLTCLRTDVFDWAWSRAGGVAVQDETASRAVSVVCDAVAAAYAMPRLPAGSRALLVSPWRDALEQLAPVAPCLGPNEEQVRALLARLSALDARGLAGLSDGVEASRRSGRPWAVAVHAASWAAHLSGRTRCAAAAQLLAVSALHRAGLSARAAAYGTWNLASGAVHALVVADLLGEEDREALVGPLELALPTA